MPRSVTPRPAAGQAQPRFIIKQGDKYYVTVSVLEYDPKAAGASAAQKDGAAQVAQAFAAGQPKLQAVEAPAPQLTAHMQTGGDGGGGQN